MKRIFMLTLLASLILSGGNAQDNEVYIPYRDGDKWGYSDKDHNIIIDPIYDQVFNYRKGLFFIEEDGKRGALNRNNEFVFEPKFTAISFFKNLIIGLEDRDKKKAYRYDGTEILDSSHFFSRPINDSLLVVQVSNGSQGLLKIDKSLAQESWVLDTTYTTISAAAGGVKCITNDSIFIYKILPSGLHLEERQLKNKIIQEEEEFFEDMSLEPDFVEKRKKRKLQEFYEYRLKSVKNSDQYQLILEKVKSNEDGSKNVQSVDTLQERFKSVRILSKRNILRMSMLSKTDSIYWNKRNIKLVNWAIVVDDNNLKGIVNGLGEFEVKCSYKDICPDFLKYRKRWSGYYEPFYICLDQKKWGVVNGEGTKIIDFKYDSIYTHLPIMSYDPGMGIVCKKNSKYGVVNVKDEIEVPFEMDYIEKNYYVRFLRLEKNGKHGLFDGKNYCYPVYLRKLHQLQYFNNYPVVKVYDENLKMIGYGDLNGRKFIKE